MFFKHRLGYHVTIIVVIYLFYFYRYVTTVFLLIRAGFDDLPLFDYINMPPKMMIINTNDLSYFLYDPAAATGDSASNDLFLLRTHVY